MPSIAALAFLLALSLGPGDVPQGGVFNGRDRKLEVPLPRVNAEIRVDGKLDDDAFAAAWEVRQTLTVDEAVALALDALD